MLMLTGDYTTQCRKYLGLCTCPSCAEEQRKLAEAKRRTFYKANMELVRQATLEPSIEIFKNQTN